MSDKAKEALEAMVKEAADDKEAQAFLEGIKYGFKYAPKSPEEPNKE